MTSTKTLAAALLLLPALALAGPSRPSGKADPGAARREAVRKLPRGAAFESGGQRYQLVGGAVAVARDGREATDALEDKGGFLVIADPAAPAAARAPAGRQGAAALPVAVNARTGQLAIVPGVLNARLERGADAAAVARAAGLTLRSEAPHVGLAFFEVPAGQDLAAAAAALAAAPGVASAELDVIEHLATPQ